MQVLPPNHQIFLRALMMQCWLVTGVGGGDDDNG